MASECELGLPGTGFVGAPTPISASNDVRRPHRACASAAAEERSAGILIGRDTNETGEGQAVPSP
jgi:hypothetical protein